VILLDTNVLSAMMRAPADAAVIHWLDGLPEESLWTTTVTIFEIRLGLALLPDGRRRRRLEHAFAKALEDDIDERVLAFDVAAAEASAAIAAERQRSGRPIEIRDVQIAGIARARKATLATRNIRHFDGLGIGLVDPWTA
jgi:toxin FitB